MSPVSPTDGVRVGPRWRLSFRCRSDAATCSDAGKRRIAWRPGSIVRRTSAKSSASNETEEGKDLDAVHRGRKKLGELILKLRQRHRRNDVEILQAVTKTRLIHQRR